MSLKSDGACFRAQEGFCGVVSRCLRSGRGGNNMTSSECKD